MHRYNTGSNKSGGAFWVATTAIFMVLAIMGALMSLWASKPLNCDDVVNYEDGSIVCLVTIQGSAQ